MSNISNKTPDALESALLLDLRIKIEAEGLNITTDSDPSGVFKRLILELHKKYSQRVVVLIDEYDKPILDHIDNADAAEDNRKVIRGFYGILKSMDQYLRFTFITGVSKFSKASIFSELNNLKDITMTEDYADICGIPVNSLKDCFGEHIDSLMTHTMFTQFDSVHDEILAWYDGYSWNGESKVINPFSLISFFEQKRFYSYWYASGTPKFLVDLIKKKPESYIALKNLEITERLLDSADIRSMELEALLFQAGYLTVKELITTMGAPVYLLDIPNFEVKDALSMHIVSALTESGEARAERAQLEIGKALRVGDLHKVLDMLRGLFASIPYELHVDLEAYYHSIFYAVMTVLGFNADAEVSTSKGRVDAVLELEDKVYVFEFKYIKRSGGASTEKEQVMLEKTLDEAMNQINDRGYADKYRGTRKTIYQAAFAFLGRDNIKMRVEKIQPVGANSVRPPS